MKNNSIVNSPILKGQTVRIRPEWQDQGDDSILFIAVDDESMGRVTIEAQLGLPMNPQQVVTVEMLSR